MAFWDNDPIITNPEKQFGNKSERFWENDPIVEPTKGAGVGPATMGRGGGGTSLPSLIKGLRDPVDAGAKLAVRAANAIGLAPDSEVQRVEAINKDAQQRYEETNPPSLDFPRMLASGAVLGPATAPLKIAPTLLGRSWQGAKMGMVAGALTDVNEPVDNADFFKKKAVQVGGGGVVGGLASPILEGGMNLVGNIAASVANRGRGFSTWISGGATEAAAARVATEALKANNIEFQKLPGNIKKSLIEDVQAALAKYGGTSPQAISRLADYKQIGIEPAKAWVTRNPIDFGKYKNAEGTDAGDQLKLLRAELDSRLMGRLEALRDTNMGDAYQAGDVAGKSIEAAYKKAKDNVTALYERFQNAAPSATANPSRLTQAINARLDDSMAQGFLNEHIRNEINKIAAGETPALPTVLYQLQKMASREARKGGNEGYAAGVVSRAIDDELSAIGKDLSTIFPDAGKDMIIATKALESARAAHRSLKMAEESIPALKAVASGNYSAEDFLSRYIVGADVKEVAAMWSKFGDKELKQAARSQLVDALKKAASGGEDAPFKQQAFANFISSPGMPQKIKIILGEDGLKEVQLVGRAASNAIRVPSGTRYNTSGSALEMMNYASRIPFIGPMVSDPLKTAAKEAAVNSAMKTGPGALGTQALDPFLEEILRASRRSAGLLSPGIAGGAVEYKSR